MPSILSKCQILAIKHWTLVNNHTKRKKTWKNTMSPVQWYYRFNRWIESMLSVKICETEWSILHTSSWLNSSVWWAFISIIKGMLFSKIIKEKQSKMILQNIQLNQQINILRKINRQRFHSLWEETLCLKVKKYSTWHSRDKNVEKSIQM